MIFFDFLYYLVFRFYHSYNEKGAESTAAGIVGGFQTLNVLTGIMLYQLSLPKKVDIDKLFVVVLFLVFQVLTYYRYIYKDNHSITVMGKRWLDKTEVTRKQLSTFLFLYGAISFIGFLGVATYAGSRK